jgi:hypothetical protein
MPIKLLIVYKTNLILTQTIFILFLNNFFFNMINLSLRFTKYVKILKLNNLIQTLQLVFLPYNKMFKY